MRIACTRDVPLGGAVMNHGVMRAALEDAAESRHEVVGHADAA